MKVVEEAERYYSPSRIRYWWEHWKELKELAVPTAGAIRYDRVSKVPEGVRLSDPLRYSDVLLDLERAHVELGGHWSIEWQIVQWARRGWDLAAIAGELRVSVKEADCAFDRATAAMAETLGWKGC
jgi:hypothetical protein